HPWVLSRVALRRRAEDDGKPPSTVSHHGSRQVDSVSDGGRARRVRATTRAAIAGTRLVIPDDRLRQVRAGHGALVQLHVVVQLGLEPAWLRGGLDQP